MSALDIIKQGSSLQYANITVLIPSRNRSLLLERAIESVLSQEYSAFEIIVLNDGSNGSEINRYLLLEKKFSQVKFVHHNCASAPHGKSRVINTGISMANGEYVCFLDDDDYWINPLHLQIVNNAIIASGYKADLYLSNQEQSDSDGIFRYDNWLAYLNDSISAFSSEVLPGIYKVEPSLLMKETEFCHMNTIVAKKSLILDVGGLDNNICYAEDYDFYLRLVDRAKYILFSKLYTSHHNVPERTSTTNLSKQVTDLEKLFITSSIYNKRYVFSVRNEVRLFALKSKIQVTKSIAIEMQKAKRINEAINYAMEVLKAGFTLKWLLYCILLHIVYCKNKLIK